MNILTILSLLSFILLAILAVKVMQTGIRSTMHRVFFFLVLAFMVATVQRSLLSVIQSPDAVDLVYRYLSAGIYLFPGIVLHLILVMTRRDWLLGQWWTYLFLYGVGFIRTYEALTGFYTIEKVVLTQWGWQPIYMTGSAYYIVYNCYMLLFVYGGLLYALIWSMFNPHPAEKKQVRIIVFSMLILSILGIFNDFVLPVIGINSVPQLAHVYLSLWSLGIWYAIKKYRLFSIGYSLASREVMKIVNDAVFITASDYSIVDMNPAARVMLGFSREELISTRITRYMHDKLTRMSPASFLDEHGHVKIVLDMPVTMMTKNDTLIPVSLSVSTIKNRKGDIRGIIMIARDLTIRTELEKSRDKLINELQAAMGTIKQLTGLLPICSQCKRIRNEDGSWQEIEEYVHDHSEADFTHGICPECVRKMYPDIADSVLEKHPHKKSST